MIKELYEESCDEVHIEEFETQPNSFLGIIRYAVIVFILSAVFSYFNLILLALIGYYLAAIMIISETFLYKEFFDRFFTTKKGYNVIGKIEPEQEVKQHIIVSGHHDAPYVFLLLEKFPKLYGILILTANLTIVSSLVISSWWAIYYVINGNDPSYLEILKMILLISIVFIIPFLFFIGNSVSPGAGDNMISSVMSAKIASIIKNQKGSNSQCLQHTRLIFASFDAEESGLRGSRAYVKRNLDQLTSIPTFVFNIDGIYEAENLKFLTKDLNSTVNLSKELTKTCQKIAKDLGYGIKSIPMPLGAGSTDAAEFAKEGIQTASLIGLSTDFIRTERHYHTKYDTIDKVEPEAVEIILKIIYGLIFKIESESFA